MAKSNSSKSHSLITFLLDRSGSMASCKGATIEAFNAYVSGLQNERDAEIDFTFLQFDTQSLDKIHVAVPVKDAEPLTNASYQPRGGTPLIDAAVKTINAVADSLTKRDDRPKVVICIQTDGEENSSTENTWEGLKALIGQKQADGWQFNFMGAGIDAYAQGMKMGIMAESTMSYDHTSHAKTASAFQSMAASAASFSAGRTSNTNLSMSARGAAGDMHAHKYLNPKGTSQHPKALDLGMPSAPAAAPTSSSRRKTVGDFSL
jgi:uncharacterized protein YegL